MNKPCRFNNSKRCYHTTCDVISSSGGVSVCPLYGGGNKFTFHKARAFECPYDGLPCERFDFDNGMTVCYTECAHGLVGNICIRYTTKVPSVDFLIRYELVKRLAVKGGESFDK